MSAPPPESPATLAARLDSLAQGQRDLWVEVRARATKEEMLVVMGAQRELAAKLDRLMMVIVVAAVTLAGSAITFALTASHIAGG